MCKLWRALALHATRSLCSRADRRDHSVLVLVQLQCCIIYLVISNGGLHAQQTPVLLPFPDLTEPATAFPLYVQQGIDPARIIRVENVYLQARTTPMCLSGLNASANEAQTPCTKVAGAHAGGAASSIP